MSFGWSVGDVATAVSLINRVIGCVRNVGGAQEHFQELESELLGLQSALDKIKDLVRANPGNFHIQSLSSVSCTCKDTLQRFREKIEPFENSLGSSVQKSRIRTSPRMVLWELLIKKDIPELRTYLVAHVGYMNLMITTSLLDATERLRTDLETSDMRQDQAYQSLTQQYQQLGHNLVEVLHAETVSIRTHATMISQTDILPKLGQLLTIANDVKRSNDAHFQSLVQVMTNLGAPDRRFTWVQEPVKFEDAFGCIWAVPSEYSPEMLHAVIRAKFSVGPGSDKVHSGEYEVFDTRNDAFMLKDSDLPVLLPGMSIKMTIVIGQYAGSNRCPRYGCLSSISKNESSSPRRTWTCSKCSGTFRVSQNSLPRPHRPFQSSVSEGISSVRHSELSEPNERSGGLRRNYAWRRFYKNISLYVNELPRTPVQFREKYIRHSYDESCNVAEETGDIPIMMGPSRTQAQHITDTNRAPKQRTTRPTAIVLRTPSDEQPSFIEPLYGQSRHAYEKDKLRVELTWSDYEDYYTETSRPRRRNRDRPRIRSALTPIESTVAVRVRPRPYTQI